MTNPLASIDCTPASLRRRFSVLVQYIGDTTPFPVVKATGNRRGSVCQPVGRASRPTDAALRGLCLVAGCRGGRCARWATSAFSPQHERHSSHPPALERFGGTPPYPRQRGIPPLHSPFLWGTLPGLLKSGSKHTRRQETGRRHQCIRTSPLVPPLPQDPAEDGTIPTEEGESPPRGRAAVPPREDLR